MTVSLRVVAGSASGNLADAIAAQLGMAPAPSVIERFPDGEVRPAVDNVCGDDIYVIQATGPPVNEHLVELLLLVDAARRAHAGRVTAVIPYVGYARQDRRTASAKPSPSGSSPTPSRVPAPTGRCWSIPTPPHWRPCSPSRSRP